MDYINEYYVPEYVDVIYGLDADLILLSLLNKNNENIYLLRENDLFVNICLLKKKLIKYYNQEDNLLFIRDFVFMCSLLGNDFLPCLTFLKIKQNGIDKIIEIYNSTRIHYKFNNLIEEFDENKIINTLFLGKIIESVSKIEDDEMKNAINKHENYSLKCIGNNNNNLNKYPILNKNYYNLNKTKNWKEGYYYSLFFKNYEYTFIQNVCNNYYKGLDFILEYYINKKNINYVWKYDYLYSPTASDLYLYLSNSINQNDNCHHYNIENYKQLVSSKIQLMIVLPPQSISNILPKEYKSIVKNNNTKLTHLYPTKFKISTFLKYYIWECYPILPNIELNDIYLLNNFIN
jgi:5'-3' exoribonuclease 2